MNGHLDLVRGQPEWDKGVVSYWEVLIEFIHQRLVKRRKGGSWGVAVG